METSCLKGNLASSEQAAHRYQLVAENPSYRVALSCNKVRHFLGVTPVLTSLQELYL